MTRVQPPVTWPWWAASLAWTLGNPALDAGLGDTIHRAIGVTGLAPTLQAAIIVATGEPCACDDRRATLNTRFPYRR